MAGEKGGASLTPDVSTDIAMGLPADRQKSRPYMGEVFLHHTLYWIVCGAPQQLRQTSKPPKDFIIIIQQTSRLSRGEVFLTTSALDNQRRAICICWLKSKPPKEYKDQGEVFLTVLLGGGNPAHQSVCCLVIVVV